MQKNISTQLMSVFSTDYWKSAVNQTKNLKVLTVTAFMVALHIAIGTFFLVVADNLRIYFSFVPTAIATLIGGPIIGLIFGFVADILGFIIRPSGAFFPGYALTAMLGAFIYALFFYKTKITVLKIVLAKLTVNIFANILLNTVWAAMLSGKGYYFHLAKSIPKNLLLLPLEVFILIAVFKIVLPIICRANLIPATSFSEFLKLNHRKKKLIN